ncbi:hypothetical protein [Saccharopolyspora rhizosphaerae]|nr:hypothetical protein [Saccharopolyspora rhizosphaerae]
MCQPPDQHFVAELAMARSVRDDLNQLPTTEDEGHDRAGPSANRTGE